MMVPLVPRNFRIGAQPNDLDDFVEEILYIASGLVVRAHRLDYKIELM